MEPVTEQKKEEVKISAEEAMNILNKQEQEKRDKCSEEINAICQKYGYTFRIQQSIELTPAQR